VPPEHRPLSEILVGLIILLQRWQTHLLTTQTEQSTLSKSGAHLKMWLFQFGKDGFRHFLTVGKTQTTGLPMSLLILIKEVTFARFAMAAQQSQWIEA